MYLYTYLYNEVQVLLHCKVAVGNQTKFKVFTSPENTHLLCKGKYHCTADLQFDWFGFDQTCTSLSNSTLAKQLDPNQSNRRSAIQRYFPLQSK